MKMATLDKQHEDDGRRAIMSVTDTGWRIVKYQTWDAGRGVWLDQEHTEHATFLGADPVYASIMRRYFPECHSPTTVPLVLQTVGIAR